MTEGLGTWDSFHRGVHGLYYTGLLQKLEMGTIRLHRKGIALLPFKRRNCFILVVVRYTEPEVICICAKEGSVSMKRHLRLTYVDSR